MFQNFAYFYFFWTQKFMESINDIVEKISTGAF